MDNHYHLLVKTPRGNLARAMRHIDGVYTQRHNRLKRTDGPLFRGRYKAIVVDASDYLLQVSRYIHRNPIELKTPLVKKLEQYPWSSYSCYLNQSKMPAWLNRESVFDELGSRTKYSAYKAFVERGNDKETMDFYSLKHTPSILGEKSFKEYAYGKSQSLNKEIDKNGLKHPVSLAIIIKAVARYFEVSEKEIFTTKRGAGLKNIPRWIAMKLCQEVGGAKLTEMAAVFNVGHYSTVSQTIRRLNTLMADDRGVMRVVNLLSQDLTP